MRASTRPMAKGGSEITSSGMALTMSRRNWKHSEKQRITDQASTPARMCVCVLINMMHAMITYECDVFTDMLQILSPHTPLDTQSLNCKLFLLSHISSGLDDTEHWIPDHAGWSGRGIQCWFKHIHLTLKSSSPWFVEAACERWTYQNEPLHFSIRKLSVVDLPTPHAPLYSANFLHVF